MSARREFKGKSLLEFPEEYVVIDLETTGLDPQFDSIIEFGAIRISGNQIVESFSELAQPGGWYCVDDDVIDHYPECVIMDGERISFIDSFIADLTGITNAMLKDARQENEVLKDFRDFVGDSIVIGHNVNFDVNFLYDSSEYYGFSPFKNNFVDTMRLSRRLLDLPHHRLVDLMQYYKVGDESAHRAYLDCTVTHICYEKLKQEIIDRFGSYENVRKEWKAQSTWKIDYASIKASDSDAIDVTNPFYGKECIFTGTLENFIRKDAMQEVVNRGGTIGKGGVTKRTNFLVVGSLEYRTNIKGNKTEKIRKAESLKLKGQDIEIISESVFMDMLQD